MSQIPLDCPFCLTKQVAFEGNSSRQFKQHPDVFLMLMLCQLCGNGIVAKFHSPHPPNFYQWVNGQLGMQGNAMLVETYPQKQSTNAPEHTPENVSKFYLQGMDNMAQNFDAAGVMFRKSLDASLKHFDPAGKGALEKRINNLPEAIAVTPAMKSWAHEIRRLGNDAAHEEDPFTKEEVKSLQAFTEVFLTYAFTLPGMLTARKAAAQNATP